MRKSESISDTELQVMEVLWSAGPGTVRQINDSLPKWAYTTVQTLLTRLERKGYVSCDRTGFAHRFSATVSRDGLLRRKLSDLIEQLANGAAAPLVLALVEEHKFSEEELDQLQKLVNRLKSKA